MLLQTKYEHENRNVINYNLLISLRKQLLQFLANDSDFTYFIRLRRNAPSFAVSAERNVVLEKLKVCFHVAVRDSDFNDPFSYTFTCREEMARREVAGREISQKSNYYTKDLMLKHLFK